MKTKLVISALVIAWLAFWVVFKPGKNVAMTPTSLQETIATVMVPDTLSTDAQMGKRVFDANCAACHGPNAAGQKQTAPPLVHIIYEPSHHGDESFQRAVSFGVRQHHWPFGDMPPVEGLARGDVTLIIAYVRELQRANGIN